MNIATPAPSPSSVKPVERRELERLIAGTHHDPHGILGPHPYDGSVPVRTLTPVASIVTAHLNDVAGRDLRPQFQGVGFGLLPTTKCPDTQYICP